MCGKYSIALGSIVMALKSPAECGWGTNAKIKFDFWCEDFGTDAIYT
jgi:hypothetical protein